MDTKTFEAIRKLINAVGGVQDGEVFMIYGLAENAELRSAMKHAHEWMEKRSSAMALGSLTSDKKAKTARENGRKGGRPKVVR